jgi:o-succinylbenzoate synthase
MKQETYEIHFRNLQFRFLAGTSRGYYKTHPVWYVVSRAADGTVTGFGEAAPLVGLSPEFRDEAQYEKLLASFVKRLNRGEVIPEAELRGVPSVCFALETLARMKERASCTLFDNDFTAGRRPVCINGLVWMGSYETMLDRMEEKLRAGFHCVKLKIGAIGFEEEMALIERIRSRFDAKTITLRVDANGAFSPDEVDSRLERLARYDIHSIEQPIKAGNIPELARLCRNPVLPIALDEELIGHFTRESKKELLEAVRPQYIVLKPSLHGGLSGTREWIETAESLGISYWITSALESNVGLSAISQFCGEYPSPLAQGLGTGQLYENNVPWPALMLQGEKLTYEADKVSVKEAAACITEGRS